MKVLQNSVLESFCYPILQASSRTNCGGAVFETLFEVLDTSTAQVVPIALKSTPAAVNITFGQNFEVFNSSAKEWGLCATIKCATVFGAITHKSNFQQNLFLHVFQEKISREGGVLLPNHLCLLV